MCFLQSRRWTAAPLSLLLAATLGSQGGCPTPGPRPARPAARPASGPPLPAVVPGSAKVFTGPQGVQVALVRLADQTYLVRVTGTANDLDAKVLRARFRRDGLRHQYWEVRFDGAWFALIAREMADYRKPRFFMGLPRERFLQHLPIHFDQAATRALVPAELVRTHRAQLAGGTLTELARFHRERRMREISETVAHRAARVNRMCKARFRVELDWSSVRDKSRTGLRHVADAFAAAPYALGHFCSKEASRRLLVKYLHRVRCRVGARPSMTLQGSTLVATVPRQMKDRGPRTRALLGDTVRWGPKGLTIARVLWDARVRLCSNGHGVFVGLLPKRSPDHSEGTWQRGLIYGGRKALYHIAPGLVRGGEGWFYDPRYLYDSRSPFYRGGVLKHYGRLTVDRRKRTCRIRCGVRRLTLKLLPLAQAKALLATTPLRPPIPMRQPYGLARDRRGIYYYVDRAPGQEKRDFRLYRGPLGRMRKLRMTNVVSDSQGDVFSTPGGALRLVIEKDYSYWIRGKRKQRLINVPIGKNLPLIYNELGVYLGVPLGSPCDRL